CAGMACLGLGVLSKSYPVVLVPAVGAYLLARLRGRAIVALLAFPLVVLAGYLPFLTPAAQRPPEGAPSHHPGTGLKTFLMQWETNDFLFMLVYDNLREPQEGPVPPHVLTPAGWRERFNSEGLEPWRERLDLPFK